jgi:hypothetical protein
MVLTCILSLTLSSMLISAWFFIVWFLLKGANAMRPSAFQRFYSILWLYILFWIILVAVTVLEDQFDLAGGYFIVFYFGAVFLALLISYLELFALSPKQTYAELVAGSGTGDAHVRTSDVASNQATAGTEAGSTNEDDATERTSLLRGDRRTFGTGYGAHNRSSNSVTAEDQELFEVLPRPYKKEQAWSGKLPSWTWTLQFLILGPFLIILCGQIALLQTAALHQTPADGSSVLTIYLFIIALVVLLMAPVTPFVHRLTAFLPTVLLLVFIGTFIYNILAFPFSDDSRLKVYFVQQVNLDTGINTISLTGLPEYTENIISQIPSSAGQTVNCGSPDYTARSGLHKCSWTGTPPNVLLTPPSKKYLPPDYAPWMIFSVERTSPNKTKAVFHISGANSRACRLLFNKPVTNFVVDGFATDERFPPIGPLGCKSVRLWSREWGGSWNVTVDWEEGGLDGRAVCLWSDANDPRAVPAYDELLRFMPRWSVATKLSDGLVEGWRDFKI